jgi:glycosyltransferase domain-containing protein
MTPRLTIVLPLKGRHLFTLRFLWHANKARMPYRFLIADGQVHSALAKLLENSRAVFPNLDIEYVRYPDDLDFSRYFAKMHDAFERVRTPYVKVADNDDFLAPAGIECCTNFLESHPDYVCCSGGIAGFSVRTSLRDSLESVVGPLNKVTYRNTFRDQSIDLNSSSATERVLAGARNTWNFYAVFRASALALMWKEVREMNPTGLAVLERFLAMRTLTIGKGRADPAIFSYWRQHWTSLQLHWTSSQLGIRNDFAYFLVRSRLTDDIANIVDRISRHLAEIDGGDRTESAERVRERLEGWVRDIIRQDYGQYAMLRRYLRTHTPWLVAWLKKRRRLAVTFEKRAMFRGLRKDGATPDYLANFKRELAQLEEVLTGREFQEFLHRHMPNLQTA